MPARTLMALVAATFAAAALAQSPPVVKLQPEKSVPADAPILKILHDQKVSLDENSNITDVPLQEMLTKLSKRHNVTFVIMEEQFRAADRGDIKERKTILAVVTAKDLTLHRFLTVYLAGMDARYLVRADYIEIVPLTPVPKAGAVAKGDGLVSVVVREKPLNEVIEKLAEEYDLSVVIAPQSGDAKTGFVTARLKNVTPEIALEMLAIQSDLRVVRKGNAFLVTSRDHANELFAEKLEQERQKIDLDKFRAAPPARPLLEPKNGLPPGGVILMKGAGGLAIPLQIRPEPKPK